MMRRPLPAAGAAVQRRTAPFPALATARLRPGPAPRRYRCTCSSAEWPGRPPRSSTGAVRRLQLARRRPAGHRRCPTCSTEPTRRLRWHRRSDGAADRGPPGDVRATGHRSARASSTRRACSRRPTSISPTAVGRIGGEPDEQVLFAVALAVRALRLGSVCVDLAAVQQTVFGESRRAVESGAAVARTAGLARGCRAATRWSPTGPAARGATAATGRRPALSGAVLARRRSWCARVAGRTRRRRRHPPSTRRGCGPRLAARVPGDGGRPSAARRGGRPCCGRQRDRRRARHGQDDDGRRGCWRCSPSSPGAAAGRAGRAHRQGRGPAAGGRRHRRRTLGPRPRELADLTASPCTGCSAGCPAAAAGSGTTAPTGCRSTSWWSTRRRWSR